MELLEVYNRNAGLKKLFSEVMFVDWYDDPVTGVCKLDNTEDWYIYNLSFFDPARGNRIFTLVNATEEWVANFRSEFNKMNKPDGRDNYDNIKSLMKDYFADYKGKLYLMKTRRLEDKDYKIVLLPPTNMHYFDSIEDVLDQTDVLQRKWLNFFT